MPHFPPSSPASVSAHDPIALALAEDVGAGDLTATYFIGPLQRGRARIIAKQPGVISGVETAAEVFRRVDPRLEVETRCAEGAAVEAGAEVLLIQPWVASIVTAERVALNFLQRLSGVATLTRRFVTAVAGTGVSILDTRKTTPGLRVLEKAAVRAGGGVNHRFGLYDMVMVKDNHLAAEDGLEHLRTAIAALRHDQPGIAVELEADTLEQVRGFLTLEGVDAILLDNMSPALMAEAVALGRGRIKFEASGGVNLETVRAMAEAGVDYISVGGLTHSAPALDLSLELLPS